MKGVPNLIVRVYKRDKAKTGFNSTFVFRAQLILI